MDDALFHAMAEADPEIGQLMDISATMVIEGVYEWKIVLQKEIMDIGDSARQDQAEADGGLTEAQRAGKQVLEDGKNKMEEQTNRRSHSLKKYVKSNYKKTFNSSKVRKREAPSRMFLLLLGL
ncbi:hypothetical protein CCP3SC1AL1_3360005 [Gammaproteobacteria bacterium]